MKSRKKLLSLIATAVASVGLGTWLIVAYAAGTATLTLSPSSGSHDIGTNFTVTVYENSTDQVNGVDAIMTYDQAKLQFVSIDTSTSGFDFAASATGGSGTVSISRASFAGAGFVTGSQVVGTVTFKALVGSGTTSINFSPTSNIASKSDSTNIWTGGTTGGTYTLTTPAAPVTPPTTTPTTPTTPSTGGSTSGSTSSGSTPSGSTKTTPKTAANSPNTAAQNANPAAPVPVTSDVTGNSGYFVAIKVLDSKGQVLGDATVTLEGQSTQTDSTGIASFFSVPAGKHTVKVASKSGNVTANVTVADGGISSNVQQFEVKVKKSSTTLILQLAAGLAVLGILAWGVIMAKKKGLFDKLTPHHSNSTFEGAAPAVTEEPDTTIAPPAEDSAPKVITPEKSSTISPTVITPTESIKEDPPK